MGAAPLKGALRRANEADAALQEYWPCEDGTGATYFGSALPGGWPMKWQGPVPSLASNSDFACSDALPTIDGQRLIARVRNSILSAFDPIQVRFLCKIPDGGITDNTVLLDVNVAGTYDLYQLVYKTGGGLAIRVINNTTHSSTIVSTSGTFAMDLNGKASYVSLLLTRDGSDTDYTLSKYTVDESSVLSTSGTLASQVITWVNTIAIIAHSNTAIGHVSVSNAETTLGALAGAVNAYRGDDPDTRMVRICSEVAFGYTGGGASEITMGTQNIATAFTLIQEVDSVGGMVWESRDAVDSLIYRTQNDLYNAAPVLTFAYTDGVLGDMAPIDDDTLLLNDVSVTPSRGASARVAVETGALGTATVGLYEASIPLSLDSDEQARNHAGWRAYLGTIDQAHYPSITINVRSFAKKLPAKLAALKDVDIGQVVQITALPTFLPTRTIDLLVIGYEETFSQFSHALTLTCLPAARMRAWVLGDGEYGRLQPEGLTLVSAVNTSATSWEVASAAGSRVLISSSTFAAMYPISLMCEGEEVTLTACTDAASPQTCTVTRSVNGVVKSHGDGAVITFKCPTPLGI
jgi:hypothetical protein